MIKTIIFGTVGLAVVVLAYNILAVPAFIISYAFGVLGAPDNILAHSTLAFSLAFIGLFAVIIIFMLLRSTKKEYEIRGY